MVTIKIECDCGQRYVFDVEPVKGQMSCPVACPACGVDGTAAANNILTHVLPSPEPPPPPRPIVVAPPSPPPAPVKTAAALKVSTAAPSAPAAPRITANASQLGLVDHDQAKHEARAKISWGNSKESVIHYLMVQGFATDEATEIVNGFYKERVAGVRANGVKQIFFGAGFMLAPVAAVMAYLYFKVLPMILLGLALMIGVWGFIKILNGIILVVVPKIEHGDVADQ